MQSDVNVIIMGDFNTPDINWYTLSAETGFSLQLCNLINYSNIILHKSLQIPHMNTVTFLI